MPQDKGAQSGDTELQSEASDNQDQTTEETQGQRTLEEIERRLKETSLEAKKYRQTNSELKARLEAIEKKKLEEQGKYKEMYEALDQKHKGLEGLIQSTAKSVAFKNEAIKAGCAPELVELLEKSANLGEIELDDKFRPNMEQVRFEVSKLKESYGQHFFKKEAKPPKDGNPAKPDTTKPDVNAELRAAKTQKEFDAILDKYGLR